MPSHHANLNQEINLKRYNNVRELSCVIEFVEVDDELYMPELYLKKLYQVVTLAPIKTLLHDGRTTPHKEKAGLLKIRNNLL